VVDLIFKDEVYAIIGAAMAVYNELGPGFLEAVYQEAFELELASRWIPFSPQPDLRISYKGRQLQKYYTADFSLYGKIVVEIKAMNHLTSNEEAQLLNEIKAINVDLGLLINFGASDDLEWSRRVCTEKKAVKSPLANLGSIKLAQISG
jgi:GxxExxY protein